MNWCEKCLYESKEGTETPCCHCVWPEDQKPTEYVSKKQPKPKTRADQIRKMDDKQLAKLFKQVCVERNLDATEEEWLMWLGWEVKGK